MDGRRATWIGFAQMSIAAALVTLPVIAIVWSLLAWLPILPAELPAQWSGNGVVSRLPTFLFAGTTVAVAGAGTAFAWHSALNPRSYERHRRVFLLSGSAAAVSAATWLISGSVVQNADQEIGAAGLLVIAALFYGLIPFALAPAHSPIEESDNTEEFNMDTPNKAWHDLRP
jgi:apolipoprotein N-acyltransferase